MEINELNTIKVDAVEAAIDSLAIGLYGHHFVLKNRYLNLKVTQ
ncbi:TPA: hypothetical protein ACGBG5_001836 [Enterococcus faecalis]